MHHQQPSSKRLSISAAILFALTGLAAGNASAAGIDAVSGNINSFDVYLGNYDAVNEGVSVASDLDWYLNNINELVWTGYEFSVFDDDGAPDVVGSTYTDYVIMTLTAGVGQSGGSQSACLGSSCEVTAIFQGTGEITDAQGGFQFTGINDFRILTDTIVDNSVDLGHADALSSFAEYYDGNLVLSADELMSLTVNPAPNTGALNPTVGSGGDFNFQTNLIDESGDTFLLTADRTSGLFSTVTGLGQLINGDIALYGLGSVDAQGSLSAEVVAGDENNNGIADYFEIMENFISYHNISPNATIAVSLIGTSPQLNIAEVVPEPGVLALLGVGLAGVGFARRQTAKCAKV
jgi:hypothetical protein